jgi:tetratricopeptide (TPR) repeat protein
VLVVLAVLVAYSGIFTTPFLFDDTAILESDALHALDWRTVVGTTRPLVQLTFALNWAAGGDAVVGYHVVNLLVHALASLVLYGIAVRSLRNPNTALVIALVWALHPLQTESVTYVIQRAESLMGLWYLLTLYCVIRGATAAPPSRGWYGAAVAACALGMLSKPGMLTAPLVVLLYDRAFLSGSVAGAWRTRRALHLALASTWSILAILLAGQEHESAATAGFAMRDVSLAEFARSQPGVILRYLLLVVWPHGLVLDYGWRPAEGLAEIALPALVLAAGFGAALFAFRRRPRLAFLVLAFLLTLLPSSSVIPIRDLAFEHRMYLPLAPLVALLVVAVEALIARLDLGPAPARRLATVAAAVAVTTLGALTILRNLDYRSAIAMWTDVTTKRPENSRAFANLAQAYMDEQRADEAILAARTALRLDPTNADAHVHLGHALVARGDQRGAEAAYADAVRLRPAHAEAHNNWGVLLAEQKRWAEAERRYAEALRLRPTYAEATNNLGVAVMELGRHDEAATLFHAALRLRPTYAEACVNLGNLFLRQQRPLDAIAQYRRALALRPDLPEVHFNLTLALASAGRREEAEGHARETIRLRPDLAPKLRQILASSG